MKKYIIFHFFSIKKLIEFDTNDPYIMLFCSSYINIYI